MVEKYTFEDRHGRTWTVVQGDEMTIRYMAHMLKLQPLKLPRLSDYAH